jgi:hypothetical protein
MKKVQSFSKEIQSVFLSKKTRSTNRYLPGLINSDDEGMRNLHNLGKYLPTDTQNIPEELHPHYHRYENPKSDVFFL